MGRRPAIKSEDRRATAHHHALAINLTDPDVAHAGTGLFHGEAQLLGEDREKTGAPKNYERRSHGHSFYVTMTAQDDNIRAHRG